MPDLGGNDVLYLSAFGLWGALAIWGMLFDQKSLVGVSVSMTPVMVIAMIKFVVGDFAMILWVLVLYAAWCAVFAGGACLIKLWTGEIPRLMK